MKMDATEKYIHNLLAQKDKPITKNRIQLFEAFAKDETNVNAVKLIQENQEMIVDKWKIKNVVQDIIDLHLAIPNATVGKVYFVNLDFVKLGMNEIVFSEFDNLENYGLEYDNEAEVIKGTPTKSGDFKITMKFRVSGEPSDSELHGKQISLIINANPKSLWKDIASIQTEDNYWKEDNVQDFQTLGDKHIVVASKRGRSHANIGSFRDDDYAFKYFPENAWSIICLADGAGSAKLARQGSKIACEGIIDYFTEHLTAESFLEFDALLQEYSLGIGIDTQQKLNIFVYNKLGSAAFSVYKKLEEFANKTENNIKDFHSTLIFTLFKKYEFGYAILSFGVGDCPIGLLNPDLTEVRLLNWLDVGEYGGGTRFITMPEIFSSDKFGTRFGLKLVDDFSYLMLMTDGIYDPKFVVEANLDKIEKWQEFLRDLEGCNDEKKAVVFRSENTEIAKELSTWMDFWSPGNHDDRTLAIIF